MSVRSLTLFASAALVVWSASAAAQGMEPTGPALPPLESSNSETADIVSADTATGSWQGEWVGDWVDDETWRGIWHGTYTDLEGRAVEASYRGTFTGETAFASEDGRMLVRDEELGWREDAAGARSLAASRQDASRPAPNITSSQSWRGQPGQPVLGYSFSEREQWLADCRSLYLEDAYFAGDDRVRGGRDGRGGAIGGILGAIAGGIAGNRIADGERLAGTLIGAGVGGLAGLAIGSLIGGSGREDDVALREAMLREEAAASRYCDAYLRRYEAGGHAYGSYAAPGGTYALQQAQPVMLVRVVPAQGAPVQQCSANCRETGREEWADAPLAEPAIVPRIEPQL